LPKDGSAQPRAAAVHNDFFIHALSCYFRDTTRDSTEQAS
jgi:hypothetical protein